MVEKMHPLYKNRDINGRFLKGCESSFKGRHWSDEKRKIISDSVKLAYKEGRLKCPWKNKIFTPEECLKRSILMKKIIKEGRHKNPMQGKKHKMKSKKKMRIKRLEYIKLHPDFMKGKNNPMYGKGSWTGKKQTLEHRKKHSRTKKRLFKEGKLIPHNKGKKMSLIARKRMSISKKKLIAEGKIDFSYLNIRPNKKEIILIKLFKNNSLPYKYVGDYSFWIDGRNPDFLNVNGQKKVIEFFGNYWHDERHFPDRPTQKNLEKHYKKYGFDCLIIWENELKDINSVLERVKNFDGR